MDLLLIGINHKTAPLKIREKFSLTKRQLKEALFELEQFGAVIISTCNRMEVYARVIDSDLALKEIIKFLIAHFRANEKDIREYFYILKDTDACRHIFRVSSGLDSQVLGETQILGQVRDAWTAAKDARVIGSLLNELFEKAVEIGRIVRQETKISQGNISIGSVAIKMCEEQLGELQDKSVLIIGAGKISTLISKYFYEKGIKGIFVSNRTYERALELASNCGGEAINFTHLKEKLKTVDIVISSTTSPHLILRKETLAEAMQFRKKPLLIMDLALPRDVDPGAKDISDIVLYDLDGLKSTVEENFVRRKQEARRANVIIQRELNKWKQESLESVPEAVL